MARIYISSTYVDLKNEREAAAQAVRRLGHQSVYMEDYVAASQKPVKKCLQDVCSCDVFVGIFAWRYGFIPDGYEKSITHLEYESAKKAGIPCLIFLLDQKAPWPVEYVDSGEERQKIDRIRDELMDEYIVSFFKNADELSFKVIAAMNNMVSMAERSFIKFKRPEELIGTKLGKYVILKKLGRGGKGVVFKVLDKLGKKEKAIKMVPPRVADSTLDFKNLKREVKIATSISHPNVVKVLGLEEIDGHFFIVMEYIEGKNLEQILANNKAGKLEETGVIDLMQKLARGLLETHKKNIIHRDIKPSNIMVTPGGQVKILDFGISYQVTKAMTELIGERQWMGTWPYMAPEQLTTRYGRENNQVDIWGFGVTMYQLLSGDFPFANKEQIKDINEKPYELEGVLAATQDIVMKCLEKDRKKRFQNMEEVLNVLNSISKRKVMPKPKKTTLLKWSLAAALIIVLIVLSVLLKNLIDRSKPGDKLHGSEKNTVTTEAPDKKPEFAMAGTGKKITKKVYKNDSGYWEAEYSDGIIMVYIPPGEFKMGSDDDDDEKPPHTVYLDGYWIGKYEVTLGQYKAFITGAGYKDLPSWVSQYSPKDNHPVVMVSWYDANAYCQWLSKKTGLTFKLPTEVQWEKAARGTDERKYPWGETLPSGKTANFADKKLSLKYKRYNKRYKLADKNVDDGYAYTAPVGSYPQGVSPYGLLDMAGNVWEWCGDWYSYNYYKSSPYKNPIGPKSGTYRVFRGGGWDYNAKRLRCADRGGDKPSVSNGYLGFRLAQDN
jgi:formylglycine-generating enzyme required for sulfatase activity/predicted Ser/Thr protein kinase